MKWYPTVFTLHYYQIVQVCRHNVYSTHNVLTGLPARPSAPGAPLAP